jgi:EAL domain-containing protein (putative c-di-GMP-specific phosphodiesterase class I)
VRAAADRLATVGDPAFRLAVNISGDSIQRPDVTDELCALVRGYRIDPGRLIVEITESSRIADIDAAARGVRRLRQAGLSVSLDDFGSGAASFGYLRALDVDSLKFDGSFLEDSGSSVRGLALIRHLARMCEELGVASVGERVETEADRALLMEAGVRYAQGYLFGRPVIDRSFRVGGRSSLSAVA